MVRARETISPASWYRISCKRKGETLTLVVRVKESRKGSWRTVSRTAATGPIGSLDFSASVPLSVGGKLNDSAALVLGASDQLNGRYANILVRVG